MTADFFYARRDGVSGATTLALTLACALVVTWLMRAQHVVPAPVEKPLTITLTALTDPTPPVPSPPPVQAQPPQSRHQLKPPPPRPAARTQSTPRPTPVRAVPTATSTPTVAATAAAPVAAPAPVSTPQNETAPPQKTTPPVTAQPLPKGNADHSYEAKVLSLVEAHKLYPTGRQAMLDHPQGTVQVCVSLTRNGEPGDVRIASSSGSMLLDLAARKLVSGLTYPAFPEQAFAGQARHEFCMSVEYQSPDE